VRKYTAHPEALNRNPSWRFAQWDYVMRDVRGRTSVDKRPAEERALMLKTTASIFLVSALLTGCFISSDDDDDRDSQASCRVDCDDDVTDCKADCSGDACLLACDTDHDACVAKCK